MVSTVMPFVQIPEFLTQDVQDEILQWTMRSAAGFLPGEVGNGRVAPLIRNVVRQRPPQHIRQIFREALAPLVSSLLLKWRMRPFHWRAELEATAYGDGAMFVRHIDTDSRVGTAFSRRLSAVYYYHNLPQQFEGGALRIHALTGDGFVDVAPKNNSIVIFPSFSPHQVMPVRLQSDRLIDSRFAINIWLHDASMVRPHEENEARGNICADRDEKGAHAVPSHDLRIK